MRQNQRARLDKIHSLLLQMQNRNHTLREEIDISDATEGRAFVLLTCDHIIYCGLIDGIVRYANRNRENNRSNPVTMRRTKGGERET